MSLSISLPQSLYITPTTATLVSPTIILEPEVRKELLESRRNKTQRRRPMPSSSYKGITSKPQRRYLLSSRAVEDTGEITVGARSSKRRRLLDEADAGLDATTSTMVMSFSAPATSAISATPATYDPPTRTDVPLVELMKEPRRSKTKAMIAEYDLIQNPRSRPMLTIDDEDLDFLDEWEPSTREEDDVDRTDEWVALGEPLEEEEEEIPLNYAEVAQLNLYTKQP